MLKVEKVVKLEKEQEKILLEESTKLRALEQFDIVELIEKLLNKIVEKEGEFWEAVARTAGFESRLDARFQGYELRIDWCTHEIHVLKEEKTESGKETNE